MINKKEFLELFTGSFWSKLSESIVPLDSRPNQKDLLNKLYDDITTTKYYPDLPRSYIVSDKLNRVSRIVPVFNHRDICVYFFCIKQLEAYIAVNRVDGTFGGWTLGNPIRLMEETEIGQLQEPLSPIPANSFNPLRWVENWREFQKKVYIFSNESDYSFFLIFDIANFYDTINLRILEDKIRLSTQKKDAFTIDLLFHFLKNWNRRFESYCPKSVGIPQDDIGDCSRILANFYLQDFDTFMKQRCDTRRARYLRYSDDLVIMAHDEEQALDILFEASKELFRINLNINASKVREIHSKTQLYEYYALDIFELLSSPTDKAKVNQGVKLYFDRIAAGAGFREDSVLKRILACASANLEPIDPHLRHRLLSKFLDPSFLVTLNYWWLNRLASVVPNRDEFFNILDAQVGKVRFNSFDYNLLKLYKKWRPRFDTTGIVKRIEEIELRN